jgi:MoaA/NifB/PqqE/SkfB family radical SAM enzyme
MSKSMYGSLPQTVDGLQNDWATELAPYGERRLKVIWDISNKCNLRCRMCHFSFDDVFYRPANHTSLALFERSAESALPLAHTLVLSASNEPLMSPHFIDILKIAARYSVPEFLFLTNGQLLSAKIADAILETGVTQVQISIDGATKETYEYIRRGAQFDRLVRNLEYLSARKRELGRSSPRLQFNVVLMQRNLEELHLFVDLAEKVGVEWIAARHLLMVKGLEMEGETLARDRDRANFHFQRFFQRVEQSKTVTVIGFPDFFDGAQLTPAAPSAHDTEALGNHLGDRAGKDEAIAAKPPKPRGKQREEPMQVGVGAPKRRGEFRPAVERSIAEKIIREIGRIPRNFQRALVGDKSPVVARSKRKDLGPPPFGSVDHPADVETHANNAIQIEGWALHRRQIARVTIEREPFDDDQIINRRRFVELGEARILIGSRPDVGVAYPLYPYAYRAGWSFELRREMISTEESFRVIIHAIAHSVDGRSADIGKRVLSFSSERAAKPYLFCSKPFDSLFIDSKGDVRPYPDCRPERPFGSLAEGATSLRDIWFGKDFKTLRQRIIDRDPPPMCLTCAYFINRNVDDPDYFMPR